eukprot:4486007-Pleurochrysis_carterae.AAC.1
MHTSNPCERALLRRFPSVASVLGGGRARLSSHARVHVQAPVLKGVLERVLDCARVRATLPPPGTSPKYHAQLQTARASYRFVCVRAAREAAAASSSAQGDRLAQPAVLAMESVVRMFRRRWRMVSSGSSGDSCYLPDAVLRFYSDQLNRWRPRACLIHIR